jgi:hypothetical protein
MKEKPMDGMDAWEARLGRIAHDLRYPPTPDLAGAVGRRLVEERSRPAPRLLRPAWAALVLLLLLAGLLAVPQVRAAVLRVLRLGAVEIIVEPTPTATLAPMATAEMELTATLFSSLLDLAGEMTLAQARDRFGFPIRLLTYPPDLGPPDRVFLQTLGGPFVILVWLEPERPDQVRLSLHLLGPGVTAEKMQPQIFQETAVHGQRALWTEGSYVLQLEDGYDFRRLVEGHVLIWTEGEITYRLETDLPLEEAVRIAESLE